MESSHLKSPSVTAHNEEHGNGDTMEIVEDLIKEMEGIQDYALNQHELHLNSRAELHRIEGQIDTVCNKIKSLKAANSDNEGVLCGLHWRCTEMKQSIARENAMVLQAEERREMVQQQIDEEKEQFLMKLQGHEEKLKLSSARFRSAPTKFGLENLEVEYCKTSEEIKNLQTEEKAMRDKVTSFSAMLKKVEEDENVADLIKFQQDIEEINDITTKVSDQIFSQYDEAKVKLEKMVELLCELKKSLNATSDE